MQELKVLYDRELTEEEIDRINDALPNDYEFSEITLTTVRPSGGWVSVKDKLPPLYTSVIIHGGVGYYNGSNWHTKMDDGDPIIMWEVKHWMEIPKPPSA